MRQTPYSPEEKRARLDSIRNNTLIRTYGITSANYDVMLADQGGGCGICGLANPGGRRLAIDHDHDTGQIRGLLCITCNAALGLLKDDTDLMLDAIHYLDRFNQT